MSPDLASTLLKPGTLPSRSSWGHESCTTLASACTSFHSSAASRALGAIACRCARLCSNFTPPTTAAAPSESLTRCTAAQVSTIVATHSVDSSNRVAVAKHKDETSSVMLPSTHPCAAFSAADVIWSTTPSTLRLSTKTSLNMPTSVRSVSMADAASGDESEIPPAADPITWDTACLRTGSSASLAPSAKRLSIGLSHAAASTACCSCARREMMPDDFASPTAAFTVAEPAASRRATTSRHSDRTSTSATITASYPGTPTCSVAVTLEGMAVVVHT